MPSAPEQLTPASDNWRENIATALTAAALGDYQAKAARTMLDKPPRTLPPGDVTMVVRVMRAAVIMGEFVERIKKVVFHDHRPDSGLFPHPPYSIDDVRLSEFEVEACHMLQQLSDALLESPAPPHMTDKATMLLWCLTGLVGEASETADVFMRDLDKLAAFDAWDSSTRAEFVGELGDVQGYANAIATKLGLDMLQVQAANIMALNRRYPEGFVEGGGDRG